MAGQRFILVGNDDERVPEDYRGDYCTHLIDTKHGWVACDGGEPEDQLLCRDWSWVPDYLNKLDREHEASVVAIRREARAEAFREVALMLATTGVICVGCKCAPVEIYEYEWSSKCLDCIWADINDQEGAAAMISVGLRALVGQKLRL
jgi:hypothetical protein